jgi:hypothetical protein
VVSVETLVAVLVAVAMVPILLTGLGVGYAVARLFGLDASLRTLGQGLGVNRWAALGPTVGAVAVVGYVEFRTDLPADGAPGSTAADVALLVLFGGAFALAVGLGNWPRYRRVASTVDAIDAPARGRTTVTGTAEATDGTVRAPLSGKPCLAWALRVREHRGLSHRGHRGVVHEAGGGTRFTVRDATGSVAVDGESLPLEGWSLTLGPGGGWGWRARRGDPPERVAAYREEHDLVPDPDHRVYEELRLGPGDTVTASGVVCDEDGRGGTLAGDGFLRTTGAPALRRDLTWRLRAGAAGAALVVAGTVALLSVAGLV